MGRGRQLRDARSHPSWIDSEYWHAATGPVDGPIAFTSAMTTTGTSSGVAEERVTGAEHASDQFVIAQLFG